MHCHNDSALQARSSSCTKLENSCRAIRASGCHREVEAEVTSWLDRSFVGDGSQVEGPRQAGERRFGDRALDIGEEDRFDGERPLFGQTEPVVPVYQLREKRKSWRSAAYQPLEFTRIETTASPRHRVRCAAKCAIPYAPKCAKSGLNATSGECFRAGFFEVSA